MKTSVLIIFGNIPILGQERITIQLFKLLEKKGITPLFLINDRYSHWFIKPELEKMDLPYKKMCFCAIPRKNHSIVVWFKNLVDLIKSNWQFYKHCKKEKPCHLYFSNDFYLISLLPALMFIKTPIVFYLVDAPLGHYSVYSWFWKNILLKRIRKLIVISSYIGGIVRKLSIKADFKIIYPFVPERDTLVVDTIENSKALCFTVTYIGQIIEKKGIELLLIAAKQLINKYPNIRFQLAGVYDIHNDFGAKMYQLYNCDRIQFLGKVDDITALFANSNVHIAPSIYNEPLGIVAEEAKQNSRPSIIFPSGGLPEVISHKIDGYICKDKTAADIIEAIEYFYTLADWGKAAGEAAYKSLEFLGMTEEVYTQKWLDIYAL